MNAITQVAVPDGFMKNAKGHLVPLDQVKPRDKLADELVGKIKARWTEQQLALAEFKQWAMAEIEAFVELSATEYDVVIGGKKGNVTIASYNGDIKVQRAMSDNITFDERLQAAKALIDECIHDWSDGANPKIKSLVDHAFQVDKEGNLNTGRVLGLRQLNIEDAKWRRAMDAISDSIQVTSTKAYLRLAVRECEGGGHKNIPLDLAAL